MEDVLNRKLVGISSKVIAIAATVLMSLATMLYNDNKNRIEILEGRVSALVYDKVSRSELREDLHQLRMQNEANKADIIARQESMKRDILDRLKLVTEK